MDGDAKFRYFQMLVDIGFKEIEVGYPSASQTEFDFVRRLIETPDIVPNDTWIQVMLPAREDLARRTIDSVRGAKKIILHMHLSTSDLFRDLVFGLTEQETIDLAVYCTKLIRQLTKNSLDPEFSNTQWCLLFTPENFQDTSIKFAVEICEAVKAAWQPTAENPIIFNLASTVEVAMPNVFADQIESFCDGITEREKVCVSVHAHNDRGCGVATAEMAQLAGADRVEGCLFGNGERTGNVDLVTLAMNLYTRGIHPGLYFGNINQIITLVEELTEIPVHPRAPYAGKYVFCTFTGTHQDAIRKGYRQLEWLEKSGGHLQRWNMPYLPMDPGDLGRKHEAIIRVNSQSGKSGVAWLVKQVFNVELPRELEIEFTKAIKAYADSQGQEITDEHIENAFRAHYMHSEEDEVTPLQCSVQKVPINGTNGDSDTHTVKKCKILNGTLPNGLKTNGTNEHLDTSNGDAMSNGIANGVLPNGHAADHESDSFSFKATVAKESVEMDIHGFGTELLTSIMNAIKTIGYDFALLEHKTQLVQEPGLEDPRTASFVKLGSEDSRTSWGVGIHEDAGWASLQAVGVLHKNAKVVKLTTPIGAKCR